MRGLGALLLHTKHRFKPLYPVKPKGSQGILATSTPKKQENNESGGMGLATKDTIEPIVAFSRPPPLPPVLGPLVALSLLDTWWNRSTDDDGK